MTEYPEGYVWLRVTSRFGLDFEGGGVPPTTNGLSRAWGSSVKVSRPSPDEPVGVVDVDVDAELGVED